MVFVKHGRWRLIRILRFIIAMLLRWLFQTKEERTTEPCSRMPYLKGSTINLHSGLFIGEYKPLLHIYTFQLDFLSFVGPTKCIMYRSHVSAINNIPWFCGKAAASCAETSFFFCIASSLFSYHLYWLAWAFASTSPWFVANVARNWSLAVGFFFSSRRNNNRRGTRKRRHRAKITRVIAKRTTNDCTSW